MFEGKPFACFHEDDEMSHKELIEEIESELYGDEADNVIKMAEVINHGRSLLVIVDDLSNELEELQAAYNVATSADAEMAQDLVPVEAGQGGGG